MILGKLWSAFRAQLNKIAAPTCFGGGWSGWILALLESAHQRAIPSNWPGNSAPEAQGVRVCAKVAEATK